MKKMICISFIIYLFMLLMPLGVAGKGHVKEQKMTTSVIEAHLKGESGQDVFRVYDKGNGKVVNMSAEEYIFGVVAAEMPALYETEALKAQAVAAYTYACYKRTQSANKEYDITTDYNIDQSFKTYEKALKDWGSRAEEYAEKIKAAVKSVSGQMITYNNTPILSVYHAVSCGQTYSAKDVWGSEITYLQSVSSEGDKLAENYCVKKEFSKEKLKKLLKLNNNIIISEFKTNNNGLVKSLKINDKEIDGSEMREVLDLPSQNFEYDLTTGVYTFTCYGYGHGVGMSQYGANYMAKQGYSYKEILNHYYSNCVVK